MRSPKNHLDFYLKVWEILPEVYPFYKALVLA